MNTPESIIKTVVDDQFVSALKATNNYNSVELSGFGKLVFNNAKATKQMEKYQSQKAMLEVALLRCDPDDKRNLTMRLNTVLKNIEHLKPKLRS